MNALAARRRHPAALFVLLLVALLGIGSVYAMVSSRSASAATSAAAADDVNAGKALFQSNCSSCHGSAAQGASKAPGLAGVGAAAVDFQVGTGRMPMVRPGVQATRGKVMFNEEQIKQLSAYVASLAPGPAVPDARYTSGGGDAAKGGEIYRVNCAMCHNASAAGGALTRGKFAPSLKGVTGTHIYEAMLTGPQSMPVFNDTNLTPEAKQDVIAYIKAVTDGNSPGGYALGNMGPVPEGMIAWTFGIGLCVLAAVWLGRKAA